MADATERYEVLAKLFYRSELIMAPGKDAPASMHQPSIEERRERWDRWLAKSAITDLADRVVELERAVQLVSDAIEETRP